MAQIMGARLEELALDFWGRLKRWERVEIYAIIHGY